MTKHLTSLMCALILAGFAAFAVAVEPAPAPQLSPEVVASLSQADFLQSLSDVPEPVAMAGCAGGLFGPCDRNLDCKGYSCPLGEIRYCFGGTGSGCEGSCGCW